MLIYLLISTVFYGFLFTVWSQDGWANQIIKTFNLMMCIASLVFAGIQAGFVISP